jgi:hypothetical protein
MSSPQMMPSPDQLGTFLWGIAEGRATSRSFRFSEQCAIALRDFIEQGTKTVLARDLASNSGTVMKAKNDVERLIDKMIEYGIEEQRAQNIEQRRAQSKEDLIREAGGFLILQESTLQTARGWFCPCFPFC